jgi:hypothetical protein
MFSPDYANAPAPGDVTHDASAGNETLALGALCGIVGASAGAACKALSKCSTASGKLDVLEKVGESLQRIWARDGDALTKEFIEMSKTPEGRAQLQKMHLEISKLIGGAKDVQAANVMKTLQDLTGTFAKGGK